ncbi:unnamed protein product [Amaranthus hypochondriacus]
MADFGISIVEKLIEVIGSELIKQICFGWGYKSELEKLEKTIITIKSVLVDAETKRDLSMAQQGYISDLKAAVYDADDLFDELFTLVKLNEIDGKRDSNIFKKVRAFFSSKKDKVSRAKQMSRRVKKIRKQLDTVAGDYNKYKLSINYTPIVRRRQDTCSYVDVKYIIGRDNDKKDILEVLLDSSASNDFCVLSIVGVGGLGKTALAQLVYQNIKNIQNGFLSLWVCVSDQDGEQFDVKTILCKILKLVDVKLDSDPSMEEVTNKFQKQFREKKYFLVLDDLWNEDRGKWIELKKYLRMGQAGSKIVVTSRSEKTASSIGSKHVHKLKGLSEEDSWCLFEMTAFGEGEKYEELVKIGENIVKKCCNNPLAIKVIGSLLHGQEISKWESIEKSGLGEITESSDQILHTLKLSYYNLTSSLKSCFSYCAIFRKDYRMSKQNLIDLWLAQGYIVPLDGGQSLDDAAEEYFLILLRRCFFEEVKKNEYGDVESVKMHDLIHDLAQEVSKEEICVVNSETNNVGEKVRHLIYDREYEKHIMCSAKVRTYMCVEGMTDKEVENMTSLRTLDVEAPCKSLISSLRRFLLLRYVNFYDHELLALPDSFTRLYNLQTLILDCWRLEKLPKDFGNLINLRHLDISECYSLIGMPLGMDKCTNLRTLPYFVAGNGNSYAKINVLQFLNKIKGGIDILIRENYEHVDDVSDTEGGYLKDMKHLTNKLNINFEGECINPEGLIKNLLPSSSSNLKSLKLESYNGKTIPMSPQHHLIHIEIISCGKLEQIPVLSKLPHLKSLILCHLDSVEYMEEGMTNSNDDANEVVDFFPSLESIEIYGMEELKGWWKEGGMRLRLRFPRLSSLCMGKCDNFKSFVPYLSPENLPEHQCPSLCKLSIHDCPKFASNLVCPSLEKLDLANINERLLITCENYQVDVTKPRDVLTRDKVSHLKSLRINGVTNLVVESFVKLKEELNQSCASSLQTLKIEKCYNLRRLSGLESLTALQELSLSYNHNLSINKDDEEPWKSFHSLCKLTFCELPEMKNLPKGMQHLTSLQSLDLIKCENLEELPQWMSCLSSLQYLVIDRCLRIKSFPEVMNDLTSFNTLSIKGCPDLEEICKNPNGEDFQKIKHIPNISINKNDWTF